ncbi:MAG: amidohydrolase [Proteobacteria bacterium]|nr:amidohydrolase [Pseudomonadota bacterium]
MFNGKLWTENPKAPEVQAIAIAGERILAVGTSESMRKLAGPGCQLIDLEGRRVVPGFNDAHVHFLSGGAMLSAVQLTDADSAQELRRRIGDYAKTLPKGAWVVDSLWDETRWRPAALPTHQLIDEVTPDNPVMIWRVDGHAVFANALTMRLAGIDRNTQDVVGGEIVRDHDGNPTGVFRDQATGLVERVVPPPSEQQMDAALSAALREAARQGVTSVQNLVDSPTVQDTAGKLREFQKFAREGRLTVRIYDAGALRDWRDFAHQGIEAGFGDALLRTGNLKAFADGSIGSQTAWMQSDFTDAPGNRGLASGDLQNETAMYGFITGADRAGLQVSIHAIGDRAIHTVIDLLERAEKEDGPRDRRFRMEHVQHIAAADLPRMAPLGIIASMQPYHAIDDGRWVVRRIGPERIKLSYAWRSLLDHGVTLAFGSDWPVAPLDPIMGIYAAATRRTLDGRNPDGWVPAERITVAEAVHAYTMGSAFAEHQEKVKGSLEPGKLADLVVLTRDIFAIPPAEIEKVRVHATVLGGAVIYQEGAAR